MTTLRPTVQVRTGPWFDDPKIANDDVVLREVRTHRHIIKLANGGWGVSPQLFTSQEGGCSVDLKSLYEADRLTSRDRISSSYGLGGAELRVKEVRDVMNRIDENNNPTSPLGIAYTPISKEEDSRANPYHCDIFAKTGSPKLGNPGSKKLQRLALPVHMNDRKIADIFKAREEAAKI